MSMIVALTGGIGSGKTVVSDHFARLNVPIIDTDIIARQIVEPGQPALAKLSHAFGKDILDGSGRLNRAALRTIAFSNTENKQRLDSITHPIIRLALLNEIQQVKFAYCVAVIPLLTRDSPFMAIADRVIAVVAEKETKITRVMQRSQLSREETIAIMDSQTSDKQRLEFADDVIHNDGTIQDAQQAAEKLHERYLSTTKLLK